MLRKTLMIFAVLALASSSQAGVFITQSSVPTVNLAGYHTYTLTANTDNGSQIQGFDFASTPQFGFFGPMNQINPVGYSWIFEDLNVIQALWEYIPQDSHFLFDSSGLTIPAGFTSESATSLRSVFAKSPPFGTSVPFVQLVIPDAAAAQVAFTGQIQTVVGSAVTNNDVAGIVPVPEPAVLSLLGLGGLAFGFIRRR